eukprot:PhF_6_TR21635/c0_g1_i1/m.30795
MSERTLERLRDNCQRGEYYEALQQYKVHTARLSNAQRFDTAHDFIFTGISDMIKFGQVTMAVDLASSTFIEVLVKSDAAYNAPETYERLRRVIHLFNSPAQALQRKELITAIQQWKHDPKTKRHPGNSNEQDEFLNIEMAKCSKELGDFANARKYYNNTSDVKGLCDTVVSAWVESHAPLHELPFHIARATLQLLCMASDKFAQSKAFSEVATQQFYKLQKEIGDNSTYVAHAASLLHAVDHLLVSITKRDVKLFQSVIESYKPLWAMDPSFKKMFSRVQEVHFARL